MRRFTILLLAVLVCPACGSGPGDTHTVSAKLENGKLTLDSVPVLEGLDEKSVSIAGVDSEGVLLEFTTSVGSPGAQRWGGVHLTGADRLLAIYRMKPWWTRPGWPESESEIPRETQALLWHRSDGGLGLILPLNADGWRFSLEGDSSGLVVVADNNMPAAKPGRQLAGLWVATGGNPYEMLESSFRAVAGRTGQGSMLEDKPRAGWADRLGWASWYSFWQDVSEEKFISALESMNQAGFMPGFVLLDDGWQDATPDRNLIRSFGPDREKFPHGLRWLVNQSKEKYGVRNFMIWHTLEGYWRGIDSTGETMSVFPQYRSHGKSNRPMPQRYRAHLSGEWNVPRPEAAESFFLAYHGYLAGQGVDGVKVDNQSDISYMTYGLGPLEKVTEQYVQALEHSAEKYFGPASVLNCMSMVTDCIYNYRRTTVMRTSTDFFPDSSSSWGPHLVLNAYNGLFWGHLIRPDWDMFQSAHQWAAFHAAARAVSGGPVYLSDPPGEHDPALIARVALPDSRVLRPLGTALPTQDILFRNPQTEPVLLKVSNHNAGGGLVLAAFHANYVRDDPITDSFSVAMNPDADPASLYAVLEVDSGKPVIRRVGESWSLTLGKGEFAVYTAAPVERGVAVLGRMGMFNPGGAVTGCGWTGGNTYMVQLVCGGIIGFYSGNEPARVELSGDEAVDYSYDPDSGMLSVELSDEFQGDMEISF